MKQLDYAAIRDRISLREVLQLIDYQPSQTRGDQWRGACPICHDHSPNTRCFSANVRNNLFQCFRCRRSGNSLDLWSEITGLQLYRATLDLCGKLKIQPVTTENTQLRNNT